MSRPEIVQFHLDRLYMLMSARGASYVYVRPGAGSCVYGLASGRNYDPYLFVEGLIYFRYESAGSRSADLQALSCLVFSTSDPDHTLAGK